MRHTFLWHDGRGLAPDVACEEGRKLSHHHNSVPRERYHLLVGGELAADWAGWFNNGTVEGCVARDGYTVLDVSVPDQAALFAVLSRLGALHLPLVLLMRLPV